MRVIPRLAQRAEGPLALRVTDLLPQILPQGVQLAHKIVLLLPTPTFDLFLPANRIAGRVVAFIVHKPIAPVTLHVSVLLCVFVIPEPRSQAVRHTGVEYG